MELIVLTRRYFQNLHVQVNSLESLRTARRIVYLWIFINYLILATESGFFFSEKAYIPSVDFHSLTAFEKIFNLLSHPDMLEAYPFFLGSIIFLAALGIADWYPRITAALVYFLMMNLDNRAQVILDGGNNLIHLIGFYLIFINTKRSQSEVSTMVTNLAAIMIKLQVVLIYATAGLLKVMGPLWTKGVALYYTMGVPEYGNTAIFHTLSHYPALLAFLTLGTVIFQISFPYLIWLRPWRPVMVAIGTSLHLSISLIMGLFMFGLAMCVSYTFFREDKVLS